MGNIHPSHVATVHAYDPNAYIVNKSLEQTVLEREKYKRDVKEYNQALKEYKERHPECKKPFITLDMHTVPTVASIQDKEKNKAELIAKQFGL
jgi:hypothetical protein